MTITSFSKRKSPLKKPTFLRNVEPSVARQNKKAMTSFGFTIIVCLVAFCSFILFSFLFILEENIRLEKEKIIFNKLISNIKICNNMTFVPSDNKGIYYSVDDKCIVYGSDVK